jgi:hypothetical protein
MNDRFAKLTEQCYEYNEMMQGAWFNKTKFAELIILECADYFGREGDRRFEVDGNWIAKTIKRNFGVEK